MSAWMNESPNHNGNGFSLMTDPSAAPAGAMMDTSGFIASPNQFNQQGQFPGQPPNLMAAMQNGPGPIPVPGPGQMRNASPSAFQNQGAYQTNPIVPSKRPRPRDDSMAGSPRPNPGMIPTTRSETPQHQQMQQQQQGFNGAFPLPGQSQPQPQSQPPNPTAQGSPYPHLAHNGSANATPSPMMSSQPLRPGSVPQRVSTASPHPFSPGPQQFNPQGSPAPSDHSTSQPNPYMQNMQSQGSFNSNFSAPSPSQPRPSPGPTPAPMPSQAMQSQQQQQQSQQQQQQQQQQQMYQQQASMPNNRASMDQQKMAAAYQMRLQQHIQGQSPNPGQPHGRPMGVPPQTPQQQQQQQPGQQSPSMMNGQHPGQGMRPQQRSVLRLDPESFMKNLVGFCASRRYPLDQNPMIGSRPVSLLLLFQQVQGRGSYKTVCMTSQWPMVAQALQFYPQQVPNAPQILQVIYEQNLLRFEEAWMANQRKMAQQGSSGQQPMGGGGMPGTPTMPGKGLPSQHPQHPQHPQHLQQQQQHTPQQHAQQPPPNMMPGQPAPVPGSAPMSMPVSAPTPTPVPVPVPVHVAQAPAPKGKGRKKAQQQAAAAAAAAAAQQQAQQQQQQHQMNGMQGPGQPIPNHSRNPSQRHGEPGPGHPGFPGPGADSMAMAPVAVPPGMVLSEPPANFLGGATTGEYIPRSREICTWGVLNLSTLNNIGFDLERMRPDHPPVQELGHIDIAALTRSIQCGMHSEVRMALDTLASVSASLHQLHAIQLQYCEDLVEALVECAEEQIELLLDHTEQASDEIELPSYEAMVRLCKDESFQVADEPEFGTTEYQMRRSVDRLICIVSIFRNLSCPGENNQNLASLADETVMDMVCSLVRYVGTRDNFLRTSINMLDLFKDCIVLMSNVSSALAISSRDNAMALLHLLLVFAPEQGPREDDDAVYFTHYNPMLHPYLPHAVDALAKMLARDEPNRSHYRAIFSTDQMVQYPFELLTQAFALAIAPIPDYSLDARQPIIATLVECRKPFLMQGLLAADMLLGLAPNHEIPVVRLWLSPANGIAPSLLHLSQFLGSQYDLQARPVAGGRGPQPKRDEAIIYLVALVVGVLKKMVDKSRDPSEPEESVPLESLPSKDMLLNTLQFVAPEWTKEGVVQHIMSLSALSL